MTDALAAEWLKIRSLRSTRYIVAATAAGVLVAALLSWSATRGWDTATPARRAEFSLGPMAELTAWLAQLCLAVLGVVTITGEHATGMIRASLVAVPRRRTLLAAKAGVVAGLGLVAGEATTFATYAVSHLIVGDRPMRFYTAPVSADVPLLLALGLAVMVFALVGLGIGAIVRSGAAAIAIVATLWYGVPTVAAFLPDPWDDRLASVALMSLPRQLVGADSAGVAFLDGALSPLGALAALLAYVAVPLTAAAVLITRRDA
jgi:hypothetical protein